MNTQSKGYTVEVVYTHEMGSMPETTLNIWLHSCELNFTLKEAQTFIATVQKALQEGKTFNTIKPEILP